jgi:hypothetical protein
MTMTPENPIAMPSQRRHPTGSPVKAEAKPAMKSGIV